MMDRLRGHDRAALLTVLGLLALAALMRLPDLATRGTWDSDQGHDMLVLRSFVRDGVVPLLGPPTSIGDVHHGAWYYYLLAPAAFLTGGDSPLAVVLVIALSGVAAVGVTWWLARSIAGPLAGLVAGGLMAVSAAAIDESTFIWNPNFIALTSSVALAGAWRAWSTGSPRWWLVAAAGTALTMQCHILGVAMLPVVGALFVADLRRSWHDMQSGPAAERPGPGAGTVLGCLAILGLSYLPLVVHELTTGFSEVRAALDYVAGARSGEEVGLASRIGIAGLRVVSWPLTGLITSGFLPAVAATAAVVGIVAWRWRAPGPERTAIRWLGLALIWSTLFLAVAAPSLATVVAGLPNDHYHAFADPMVFTLVGLGAAALARSVPGRAIAAVGLVALVGWNLTHLPPAVHPDGGFPAAVVAAERVDAVLTADGMGREAVVPIRSLPKFKSTESMAYPLVRLGRAVSAETPDGLSPGSEPAPSEPGPTILLCDSLFEASIGGECGGPAEGLAEAAPGAELGPLLDRSEVAPGRWVSVYGTP
jgi:4-amino-4-deoxy-L-arabinose transferase-like glycosyltransferase